MIRSRTASPNFQLWLQSGSGNSYGIVQDKPGQYTHVSQTGTTTRCYRDLSSLNLGDELGDIHIFCGDDRERAEEAAEIMGEDPHGAELTERH